MNHTNEELLEVCKKSHEVREAQKAYFAERDPVSKKGKLVDSKRLESELDGMLARMGFKGQSSLF